MLSAIQDLSSVQLLIQFISTSTSQILLTYCLIKGTQGNVKSFIYATHLIFITWELLFPCYFGNMLIESGEELERAIYDCSWFEQTTRFRRLLHIFLIRTQCESSLKAGNWITVNHYTFSESLQNVYLVATFLKNLD